MGTAAVADHLAYVCVIIGNDLADEAPNLSAEWLQPVAVACNKAELQQTNVNTSHSTEFGHVDAPCISHSFFSPVGLEIADNHDTKHFLLQKMIILSNWTGTGMNI